MNIERQIISACLKNPQYIARVRRAKIQSKHFKDATNRDIFQIVVRAIDHHAFTSDAIVEFFKNDNYDTVKKPIYLKTLEKLINEDSGSFEMSLAILERERLRIDFLNSLSQSVEQIENGKDLETVIKNHNALITSLSSGSTRLVTEDHFATLRQRDIERMDDEQDAFRLKFIDNFQGFEKYFKRGLTPGTITTLEGPTGFGKSVLIANLTYIATLPQNGLNCYYVYSENMRIPALARLDSIMLDVDYDLMYSSPVSDKNINFMEKAGLAGYGKLITSRAPYEEFDVDDLRVMLDDLEDQGIAIHCLMLDSASHMRPKRGAENFWLTAYNIFKDLKVLAEERNISIITTRQQKASEVNKKDVDAFGGADGAKISQIVDNIIAGLYNPKEDDIAGIRKLVATKSRDGGQLDKELLRFKMSNSLRYIPEQTWISEALATAPDLLRRYQLVRQKNAEEDSEDE